VTACEVIDRKESEVTMRKKEAKGDKPKKISAYLGNPPQQHN